MPTERNMLATASRIVCSGTTTCCSSGMVKRGSTISQQMIKNMLLSPSRNPLRKWHELWLTIDLKRHVSKRRILEIYMNVAEFGQGIYGAEAGARHYWGKSAAALNPDEAIELAASLSNPVHNNPVTRTSHFQRQVRKIRRNLRWSK